MSQFLAEKVTTGELELESSDTSITYQDPCRLGRHLGIYDEPRQVLQNVSPRDNGAPIREMQQAGKRSLCCGVSAWMNCSTYSKSIQRARLKEAKQTKADRLVLACPKCEIHF